MFERLFPFRYARCLIKFHLFIFIFILILFSVGLTIFFVKLNPNSLENLLRVCRDKNKKLSRKRTFLLFFRVFSLTERKLLTIIENSFLFYEKLELRIFIRIQRKNFSSIRISSRTSNRTQIFAQNVFICRLVR